MNAQDFINSVATGNAAEAKDTLNNLLSARAFEALETKKVEIAQTLFGGYQVEEEVEELDELSKNTLRSYLKGSKAEAGSQLRGDVSDKAASLGRTQQDKDDSRYEGGKLAKRKLGAPGSIPPKVMAK